MKDYVSLCREEQYLCYFSIVISGFLFYVFSFKHSLVGGKKVESRCFMQLLSLRLRCLHPIFQGLVSNPSSTPNSSFQIIQQMGIKQSVPCHRCKRVTLSFQQLPQALVQLSLFQDGSARFVSSFQVSEEKKI